MKYWSKSALSVYRYLEHMANTIDKIVVATGKNSNHQNVQKYQTTLYQTSKIIEFTERKRKMINLKIAVENALQRLPKIERRILVLAFVDGVKSEMISQLLEISLRTYFRKKSKALDNFKEQMIACGFDLEFFENEYACENWMMSIYQESVLKYNKDEENLDSCLIKRMIKEVSKINLTGMCNI